jgi:hypothetical protein
MEVDIYAERHGYQPFFWVRGIIIVEIVYENLSISKFVNYSLCAYIYVQTTFSKKEI